MRGHPDDHWFAGEVAQFLSGPFAGFLHSGPAPQQPSARSSTPDGDDDSDQKPSANPELEDAYARW